jgi:hypothetical protein
MVIDGHGAFGFLFKGFPSESPTYLFLIGLSFAVRTAGFGIFFLCCGFFVPKMEEQRY